MRDLTIRARSGESARALCRALADFHPELVSNEAGDHLVAVRLGSDRRVLEMLSALELFVENRRNGQKALSFPIEFDGHTYVLRG